MTLTLSDFAAEVLREQARAHALSPEEFVDRAARYYVTERSTGRPARKIPAFLEPSSDGREAGLQFDLDKAAWEDLEAVAKSEETSVERLLEHAVLLLIADLDSGRVATRFVEGPGDRPHDDGEWS